MKVLVTGANGFIGSAVVEALLRAGHEVVACVRSARNLPPSAALHAVERDIGAMVEPGHWLALLDGVDHVVNCAGILREPRRGDFARVHVDAPWALVQACRQRGVARFVQVSALGDPRDGEFIASKHRFDALLQGSGVPAVILRPSVVLSVRGSYGGTSLLRALAALPVIVALPGDGSQRIQPILLEDLAELVLRCLASSATDGDVLEATGPERMTLSDYLALQRAWLRLGEPLWLRIPLPMVRLAAWIGGRIGGGPFGPTITGMLERGNVAADGEPERVVAATGFAPRCVRRELGQAASFVQDRWHARLHLLRVPLRLLLVVIWILSGIAGLLATATDYAPILDPLHVPAAWQHSLVLATSALDIGLGLGLLVRWRPRAILALMLASVLAYSVLLGIFAPALWLDPLGGLLKNFGVLGLLLAYAAIDDPR